MRRKIIASIMLLLILSSCTAKNNAPPLPTKGVTVPLPSPEIIKITPPENITVRVFNFTGESTGTYFRENIQYIQNIEIEYYGYNRKTFMQKLVSADCSIDLYRISNINKDLRLFLEHEYYFDLSSDYGTNALFDEMFTSIQGFCTYDDSYFGFPAEIYSDTYANVDCKRLEALGIEPKEIASLYDVIAFDEKWVSLGHEPGTSTLLYQDDIIKCMFYNLFDPIYTTTDKAIDWNCLDMASTKALYNDLKDHNLLKSTDTANMEGDIYPICIHVYLPNNGMGMGCCPFSYKLKGDNTKKSANYIAWYIINPSTSKINDSLKFIQAYGNLLKEDPSTCIVNNLDSITFGALIYKDINEYIINPDDIHLLNQELLCEYESGYNRTNLVLRNPNCNCLHIFTCYLNDEIPLSKAIEQMQGHVH